MELHASLFVLLASMSTLKMSHIIIKNLLKISAIIRNVFHVQKDVSNAQDRLLIVSNVEKVS